MQAPETVMETQHQDAFDTVDEADSRAAASPAVGDDFLQVKSRLIPDEVQPAEADMEDGQPIKKRRKLKINPGKTSGSRIVFDEEGTGVEPLAAMADTGAEW